MATRPRLIIGSTVIDSVEDAGATTSTIDGAVLAIDYESGMHRIRTGDTEDIPIIVRVKRLVGDTLADVIANAQLVLDALDTMNAQGVIIEYESGQTLVEIDPATVGNVSYTADEQFGDEGIKLTITISAARIDPGFDGSGEWQIQRNTAGRIFVVGRLNYRNLLVALADVALMRAGTKRPVWMPSSCRVVEDTATTGQVSGDIAGLSIDDYRPVTIPVMWEQMASHMASHPAFANSKRAEWSANVATLPPLDFNAGQPHPGMAFSLNGTSEFKSEQNATYDPSDPAATSAGDMKSQAIAQAQVMLEEAERRLGVKVQLNVDIDRGVTGADGVYSINLKGIAMPDRFGVGRIVTSWNETLLVEHSFKGQFTDTTDGGRWEWEHPGGDEITVTHTLIATSLGAPVSYVRPGIVPASQFRRVYKGGDNPSNPLDDGDNGTDTRPFKTGVSQGATEFRSNYTRRYVYVPKGKGPKGPEKTSSSFGGGSKPQGHAGQFA